MVSHSPYNISEQRNEYRSYHLYSSLIEISQLKLDFLEINFNENFYIKNKKNSFSWKFLIKNFILENKDLYCGLWELSKSLDTVNKESHWKGYENNRIL